MDPETIGLVQSILDLGWPAVVLIQSIVLYRAHSAMTDRYLAHLERESERRPLLESERSDALA